MIAIIERDFFYWSPSKVILPHGIICAIAAEGSEIGCYIKNIYIIDLSLPIFRAIR